MAATATAATRPAPARRVPSEPAPAPAPPPPRTRVPWSPLGLAMALALIGTLMVVVVPVLLHSGDVGVIAHGLAFLLTGGAVAGALLYVSTLPA